MAGTSFAISRHSCLPLCVAAALWAHAVLPVSSSDCVDEGALVADMLNRAGIPIPPFMDPCAVLSSEPMRASLEQLTGLVVACNQTLAAVCPHIGISDPECDSRSFGDLCCATCMDSSGRNVTDIWGTERDALREVLLQAGLSLESLQGDNPCSWHANEVLGETNFTSSGLSNTVIQCGLQDDEGPTYALFLNAISQGHWPKRPLHEAIGELRGLRALHVETVIGELPLSMAGLGSLQELSLAGYNITNVRDVLSNLTSLAYLRFADKEEGELGDRVYHDVLDFSRLHALEKLSLEANRVVDVSAESFAGNLALRQIGFDICCSGTLPRISHLQQLTEIFWRCNGRCQDEWPTLTDISPGGLPCFPGQLFTIQFMHIFHMMPWPDDWRDADCVTNVFLEGPIFDGLPRWGRPNESVEARALESGEDTRTRCSVSQVVDAPKFGQLRSFRLRHFPVPRVEDFLTLIRGAPRLDYVECFDCGMEKGWPPVRGDDLADTFFYSVPSLKNTSQGLGCELQPLKARWRTLFLERSLLLGCDVACINPSEGPEVKCFQCPRFSRARNSSYIPYSNFDNCVCQDTFSRVVLRTGCPASGEAIHCGCEDDEHLRASQCRPCSEEMSCRWSDPQDSLKEPRIKSGYWAQGTADCAEPLRIFECQDDDMCQPLAQHAECGGRLTQCLDGRSGIACSRCLPGHVGGTSGPCEVCNRESAPYIILAVSIGIVVALCGVLQANVKQGGEADDKRETQVGAEDTVEAVGNTAGESDSSLLVGAASQALKFFQSMSLVSRFDLKLPAVNVIAFRPFRFASMADLDVGMALQCLTDGSFRYAAISWWLLPWFLTALCIPAYGLSKCLWLAQQQARLARQRVLQADRIDGLATVLWLWSTFFNTFVERSMTFFNCVSHPGGDSTHIEHYYLLCDSDEYNSLFPFAVVFAVLNVGVGLANVAFLVVVLGMRPGIPHFVKKSYKSIYSSFNHQAFFWALVAAAKDFILVAISCAFESTSVQGFLSVLLLSVYLVALTQFQPFGNTVLTRYEIMLTVLLICNAQVSCSAFPPGSMNEEEKATRSALLLAVQLSAVMAPLLVFLAICLPSLAGGRWSGATSQLMRLPPFSFLGLLDDEGDLKEVRQFFKSVRDSEELDLLQLLGRFDEFELKHFGCFLQSLQNVALGYHHKRRFNGRIFDDADTPVLLAHVGVEGNHIGPRVSKERATVITDEASVVPDDSVGPLSDAHVACLDIKLADDENEAPRALDAVVPANAAAPHIWL